MPAKTEFDFFVVLHTDKLTYIAYNSFAQPGVAFNSQPIVQDRLVCTHVQG